MARQADHPDVEGEVLAAELGTDARLLGPLQEPLFELDVAEGLCALVAGDGQVSLGQTVIKGTARKVRRLSPGGYEVVAGFAGSTADAFTLLERLETKLEASPGQLSRAAVELAKDWRTDKFLRRLEAMLIAVDKDHSLLISGNGDVIEPENGLIAIGSGGPFAQSAAMAYLDGTELDAEQIVRKSLQIASDICIYTNENIIIETLEVE